MKVNEELEDFLQSQGLSDEMINSFLEHHGVKGQKWGVRRAAIRSARGPDRFGNRNNASFQRKQDRLKRVATGKASVGEMLRSGLLEIPSGNLLLEGSVSGGARRTLEMNKRHQNKVLAGKRNTLDILNRLGGIDVRELNFDV